MRASNVRVERSPDSKLNPRIQDPADRADLCYGRPLGKDEDHVDSFLWLLPGAVVK